MSKSISSVRFQVYSLALTSQLSQAEAKDLNNWDKMYDDDRIDVALAAYNGLLGNNDVILNQQLTFTDGHVETINLLPKD